MRFSTYSKLSDVQWNRLQEGNRVDLKRFFGNVSYLARVRYGSRNKAILELRRQTGYATTSQTVKYFIDGEFTIANFNLLRAWCILFGLTLVDMLSRDFKAEQEALEAMKKW